MTTPLKTTAHAIALAAAFALTGCAGYGQPPASATPVGQAPSGPTAAPAPVDAPAMATPCNAQPAQFAVGQSSTASVMESARARSGAQMARILRPGQITTKEFNAQRLNLEVDATGRIIAVRCG
ncbi:I78 family peptidase inhibitor [Acidovorax sp. RAC01]|uniref:I78 family peptidase inhibitor n=1 Tax=Acidovorax sp. RAC01 TaxID=1842533 RepID=UPI00083E79EE|nr:I78 family peptidase inhibitor [Acidovorax sp. RAC01]AOG22966.1 peptidase inhibitor I78 family protein [Acidovorax sp. RAC01]